MLQSPEGGTTSLPQYLQKRKPLAPTTDVRQQIGVQKPPMTQPSVAPPAGQGTKPSVTSTSKVTAPQPVAKLIVPPAPPPPAAPTNPFMQPAKNPADQNNDGVPDDIRNYTLPWGKQTPGNVNDYDQNGLPDAPGTPIKNPGPGLGAVQANPFMAPKSQAPAGRVGANGPMYFNDTPGASEFQASQAATSGQPSGANFSMGNFGQFLEQMMGGSRYTDPQIQQMRTQSTNQLNDIRRQEEDRAKVDAARRGVYYGSPLTNSLGDISERFIRGQADAETNLMKQIADANAMDRQNNIGNIFKYGQGELDSQETQAGILEKLAQLGMQGGPTLNGAFGSFDSLQGPQSADDTSMWEMIGRAFGGRV